MSKQSLPDFMLMYEQYQALDRGPKAELRRIADVRELVEIPTFYHLLQGRKGLKGMQRLVYCLPHLKHQNNGISLGHALAKAKVNEKRLFMVIRSEFPNDLIQLRRLLKMVEPTVNWMSAAKTIFYWNDLAKRTLLEDFFFYQNTVSTAHKSN